MSQVITNPTPKTRFQASPDSVSKHRDMVASREFERAIDFALLHYQRQVTELSTENFNVAGANQFRLIGAQEFVAVLRNLSEAPTLLDRGVSIANLNHKV